MLPANMRAKNPRSISEKEATKSADDREDADFVHDMERTGMVATDGSGGKTGKRSERHRSVGAGAVVVTFNDCGEPIKERAIRSNVAGRQTVPRAETWAVLQVLRRCKGIKPLQIIKDALYAVKGFQKENRRAYGEGTNGDI